MVRKTIAIIGDIGGYSSDLLKALSRQELRLLIVSGKGEENLHVKGSLQESAATAEIEYISCEREGCWEADIIMITPAAVLTSSLVEKIRAVATQKIVIRISPESQNREGLQDLLPYSRVVELQSDLKAREMRLLSKDADAKAEVAKIFKIVDYDIKE